MIDIKTFFENLGFSFELDIRIKNIEFINNRALTKKIYNKVYIYNSPENVNTSFYIFDIFDLTEAELFELKRYIWNEDKSEFYFYPVNNKTLSLFYAKSNPQTSQIKSVIDSFEGNDIEEIEKINKWNFETGSFWISYKDFIKKISDNERIDNLLISRLILLKNELLTELGNDKEKQVQSLIDRTLFIKFLEDRHIINSFFYENYFGDKDVSYKKLLGGIPDVKNINLLFKLINEIFDNVLFKTPYLEEEYIINASKYIYNAISGEIKGQLSLFDFQFDIIPIEFISHIYEVFLEDKQLNEGIFYTPPKLAQLIIDDTISKQGKVLDPSCGSGMFLILSFRKMLNDNNLSKSLDISENIKIRLKILKENIFGIEKQYTAWRLSIFALYLEIFNGLEPLDIKEFIAKKIESGNIRIFEDFSKNIINGNSLEMKSDKRHFNNLSFDYIIGNPPFLQVSKNDEEIDFFNSHKITINEKEYFAKDIIGKNQISQAFMLKIKDWANADTKFGFVLNSSNFYNEGKSVNFQEFFFENYQIKNFYELSRVKKILFKKATESVIVAIFNNKPISDNIINYYPVDLELFSEKFKLLVIKEDSRIEIIQSELLNREIVLRELLSGNRLDLNLIKNIKNESNLLNNYIISDQFEVGIRITGSDVISKTYKGYKSLPPKERGDVFEDIKSSFISKNKNTAFDVPYVEYKDIKSFVPNINKYLSRIDVIDKKFRRNKEISFFEGKKILIRKIPTKNVKYLFEVVYSNRTLCFPDGVFKIKLKDEKLYLLVLSVLNSDLISYFLNIVFLKRTNGSFPHISKDAINGIPIPKKLDDKLVQKITKLGKQLTNGELVYENETKDKLNDLIYDLYDLGYLERQRIKDFFIQKRVVESSDMDKYKETLNYTLDMYFENKPNIEYSIDLSFGFNMLVVGVFFDKKVEMPKTDKVLKYEINKILKETNNNLFAMREFLFGKDCIYIIKDRQLKNWTETKAYEDGKLILNTLN